MFLTTAFVAICLTAFGVAAARLLGDRGAARPDGWVLYVALMVAVFSPFWIPFVVLAYAAGRRAFTWQLVVAFAVVEGLSIPAMWAAFDAAQEVDLRYFTTSFATESFTLCKVH